MARRRRSNNTKSNSATLGFEATLWAAADKLRNNMDAAEYKHVVLGLIIPEVYLRRLRGEACPAPQEDGPGRRFGGPESGTLRRSV